MADPRRLNLRARGMAQRVEPPASTADVERILVWVSRELRAERMFGWYRSRRPRKFILACPPRPN